MIESESRPWGDFHVLYDGELCKVKKIVIKPDQAPSYQYHFKREELWHIVQGSGVLKLDDELIEVSTGQTVNIKLEQKHQIKNTGEDDLIFIEIQTGSYFGEDDIVRIEDNYGRVLYG